MMTSDEVRATALQMIEAVWGSDHLSEVMKTFQDIADLIESNGFRIPQDGTAFLCEGKPLEPQH